MKPQRYLLDTHSLIWFQIDSPQISANVRNIMDDELNEILFSQISLFEISIKQKVGKLITLLTPIENIYQQALKDNLKFLPIENQHIFNYSNIPFLADHRDPFDRLLLATALVENAIILSADQKLHQYGDLVNVIW